MSEVRYISKVKHEKQTPQTGTNSTVFALVNFLKEGLKFFFSKLISRNPYADHKGRPKKGYRAQFYQFEEEKRNRRLNKISIQKIEQLRGQEKAFFKRMQS